MHQGESVMGEVVTVTEAAAVHIRQIIEKRGAEASAGLRFGLQDGGCSGYTYLIDIERSADEEDLVVEQHGVKVFVHPLHVPFVSGTVIDFKSGTFEAGFDIQNPHAKRHCGCGDSFGV
jgi:iron-sulfur cluster assembly protein